LALAGLRRLGRESAVTEILSMDVMLPAIGQGALALEAREGDAKVLALIKAIDHAESHLVARAERAFLKTLGGSCQTPIAAHGQVAGSQITLRGLVVDPSGSPYIQESEVGPASQPETVGQYLAEMLLAHGAENILGR
jgi:hydroxymethylbilane synthase